MFRSQKQEWQEVCYCGHRCVKVLLRIAIAILNLICKNIK